MKRIGFIAAVGFVLVLSAYCAADTATQPTSPKSKAETFLLVEVKGTIGEGFSAAKMKAAIAEARKAKAAAIVLSMDTSGGSVAEAEAIVNLIIENKDLRFIALVNKALSAGAAITLACKEIYVMETATIGAAVSYIPDKRGLPANLPADVAEKFQSAWRAVCRKAADHGGHSSLLAEGMVDPSFAITKTVLVRWQRTENGEVALDAQGFPIPGNVVILERDGKGEVVKASGRILTLTAKEAVACGLAKAVVPDVADLGTKLGMREWRKPGSAEAKLEDDGSIMRLPELRTLFSQYRLLLQNATATGAAVTAKKEEIKKKLIGRNVELAGKLIDVRQSNKGLVVEIRYVGPMVSFTTPHVDGVAFTLPRGYSNSGDGYTAPVEIIEISLMSADNRWVSAKTGSSVVVTGRIRDIKLTVYMQETQSAPGSARGTVWPTITFLDVAIAMDELGPQEVLRQPHPAPEPKSTASAPVDTEAEARKQLNLAENYRSAGLASKALDILRSVIKDFPNTAAAKEAKEQVKQLEDEAKKAGKGS